MKLSSQSRLDNLKNSSKTDIDALFNDGNNRKGNLRLENMSGSLSELIEFDTISKNQSPEIMSELDYQRPNNLQDPKITQVNEKSILEDQKLRIAYKPEKLHDVHHIVKRQARKLSIIPLNKQKEFEKGLQNRFGHLKTYVKIDEKIKESVIMSDQLQVKSLNEISPIKLREKNESNQRQVLREKVKNFIHEKEYNNLSFAKKILPKFFEFSKSGENFGEAINKEIKCISKHDVLDSNNDTDKFFQTLQEAIIKDEFSQKNLDDLKIPIIKDFQDLKNIQDHNQILECPKDKKYYETYKIRAEKVISILKKTTKSIFNEIGTPEYRFGKFIHKTNEIKRKLSLKSISEKSDLDLHQRHHSLAEPKKSNNNTKFAIKESGDGVKKGVLAALDNYMTSNHFLSRNKSEKFINLDLQYKCMMKKVSEAGIDLPETDGKKYFQKNYYHTVTGFHKKFMSSMLDEVNKQSLNFKSQKDKIKREIELVEDGFERDVDQYLPKSMESLKLIEIKQADNHELKKRLRITPKMIRRVMMQGIN